ncbi:MAG: hypothetical protein RLZZ67_619 [Candidatus Parcubacteria bacterium]|jgi:hypothetical protein
MNTNFKKIIIAGLLLGTCLPPLISFAATIGRPVSNTGLVGWWSFDEGSGTIAHDLSGNRNNGTFVGGPVWVDGKKGKALDFDGIDDYVTTTVNRSNYAAITVSAWYKFEGNISDTYSAIIAGQSADFFIGKNTGNSNIGVQDSAYNGAIAAGTNAWDGNWHQIIYTFSGGAGTVYLDGRSVGSSAYSGGSGAIWIGQENEGPGYDFNGKIDDVRIYSRALSPAEVTILYGAGAAIKKNVSNNGLVGWWRLDEGTSTVAHDFSGLGNGGVLVGSPTWVAGKKGGALQFSGSSQSVNSIPTNSFPTGTNPVSMFAWIKTTSTVRESALSYGNSATGQAATLNVNQIATNGRFMVDFYNSYADSGVVVNDGRWHHVGFSTVGNTTTVTMYVDGVAYAGTLSGAAPNIAAGTNAQIGRWITAGAGDTGGYYFNGSVDDPRVYNRVVSAAEVQALYTQNQTTVNASQNNKSTGGLIGLWSFDGKDMDWRSNKALDKSGNGNDGLLTNLPTTTAPTRGKVGQALSFDADSKCITSTNNTGLTGDVIVTVSAWIYPTNNTNAFQMIAGQAAADVAKQCINLILRTGRLSLDFCSGGYTQSATLATNRWYHVAAVKTQGLLTTTTKLYVDGVDVTSGGSVLDGGDGTPNVTNSVVTIGRFAPGAQHGFRGTIDDVRVYNRGLSAADVKQLYLQGK